MIPIFPEFKNLSLEDQKDVTKMTSEYPPYSDFNFVSLWSWDTKGAVKISSLNSNLVVRFTDYLSGEPFYSFLGTREVDNTIQELLALSSKEGLKPILKLIPGSTADLVNMDKHNVLEDRDSFDYVYSTEKIMNLNGSEYSNQRRLVKRFRHGNAKIMIKELDLKLVENRMQVLKLNDLWKANKELNFNNRNEEKALVRLLNSADYFDLVNFAIFVGDDLVAFTINEKFSSDYSVSYFAKFDIKYRGSYLYSMQVTSERMFKENFKYINCEQDLGLMGLRSSKESLGPVFYLKKYTVTSSE